MNTAAGTKENDTLGEPERGLSLRLVARSALGSTNREFRIGVADDVFARVDYRGHLGASIQKRGNDGIEKRDTEKGGDSIASSRFEPVLALAAAGLLFGYLLGRYSRK